MLLTVAIECDVFPRASAQSSQCRAIAFLSPDARGDTRRSLGPNVVKFFDSLADAKLGLRRVDSQGRGNLLGCAPNPYPSHIYGLRSYHQRFAHYSQFVFCKKKWVVFLTIKKDHCKRKCRRSGSILESRTTFGRSLDRM